MSRDASLVPSPDTKHVLPPAPSISRTSSTMPVDRGTLEAQLREIGETERWWEQREFRELPQVLHPGERIEALATGTLDETRRPRVLPRARWLFVVTGERLVLLRQEKLARRQIDLAPGQIVRVHQRSRLLAFHVVIETAHKRFRLRIDKTDAFRFASALSRLAPHAQAHPSADVPALPRPALPPAGGGELEAAVRALQAEVAGLRARIDALEARGS